MKHTILKLVFFPLILAPVDLHKSTNPCEGASLLVEDGKYVVVTDQVITPIKAAVWNEKELSVRFLENGKEKSWTGPCQNGVVSLRNSKMKLHLNADGSGYVMQDQKAISWILKGEIVQPSVIHSNLQRNQLDKMLGQLLMQNRIPALENATCVINEDEEIMNLALVFPVGYLHPEYGNQPKVRMIVFRQILGRWTVGEDPSKLGN